MSDNYDDTTIPPTDATAEEGEATLRHITLLESWWTVLRDGFDNRPEKVSMTEAASMFLGKFPWLQLGDVPVHLDLFYTLIADARDVVYAALEEDPAVLYLTKEEDGDKNSGLYVDVVIRWHQMLIEFEKNWTPADTSNSRAGLSAASLVAGMLVGENGLVAHLEQINFTMGADELYELVELALKEEE